MASALLCLSSEELDAEYGYKIQEIEKKLLQSAKELRPGGTLDNLGEALHQGHQTWVGLDPQTLNTPYAELVQVCHLLKPGEGELLVDLGAGYGRMGLVLRELYPKSHFLGLELVLERVNEAKRVLRNFNCHQASMSCQDLMDPNFTLPEAEFYFLYDYGKTSHIRSTLKKIELMAERISFKVIARGQGSRSIIEHEHPWLCEIHPVHHQEHFSIYTFA